MTLLGRMTVPGRADQVQEARGFTRRMIGERHPNADVAALLISEVVTNSVIHSDSGLAGGTVTITVIAVACGIRVEVIDDGGQSVPTLRHPADGMAEGGRGLQLLDGLSAEWGYFQGEFGTVTWFELAEPTPE
jgi:anti-sigma regulatory factor (Ser/Thr protein kinase)